MMFNRRRAGLSVGKSAVPVDLPLKTFFAHRFLDYVHLAAEQLREMMLEIFQAAEIVKAASRKVLRQPNRYIDIAGTGIPPRGGTEQRNTHYASSAEFLFVRP